MKYVFIDQDGAFTSALAELLPPTNAIAYITGNIQELPTAHTAFVTLLNSLVFMDSGVDRVFSREMFPGVEKVFRSALQQSGSESLVGKKYLPIGSSMMSKVRSTTHLIGAPTMLMPQPVSNTRNAYYATLAALYMADQATDVQTLVVPPPACGWGKMSPLDSARQVWWAFIDHRSGLHRGRVSRVGDVFIYRGLYDSLGEQPQYYENSEFKEIAPQHLTRIR